MRQHMSIYSTTSWHGTQSSYGQRISIGERSVMSFFPSGQACCNPLLLNLACCYCTYDGSTILAWTHHEQRNPCNMSCNPLLRVETICFTGYKKKRGTYRKKESKHWNMQMVEQKAPDDFLSNFISSCSDHHKMQFPCFVGCGLKGVYSDFM